ncbi:hypothetical protein JCM18750_03270 [Halostagnicola bangensis]
MSGADGDGDQVDRTSGSEERADWPVTLEGVTETVVTTLGPNGRWNAAALGLFAEADESAGEDDRSDDIECPENAITVSARTWGNTRTRRNFHRQGTGYVQFTRDPVDFVDAALSISELEEPVLESTDAWVRVSVEQTDTGSEDGTRWEEWQVRPSSRRSKPRRYRR